MSKERLKNVLSIICAIAASVAFVTDFDNLPGQFNVVSALLIPVLVVFFMKVQNKYSDSIPVLVCAAVTSFFILIGRSYSTANSSEIVFGSGRRILFFVISMVGFTGVFYYLYLISLKGINKLKEKDDKHFFGEKIIFGKLGTFKTAAIILVMWLPVIVLCYPGAICNDSAYQIYQTLGRYPYDTIHPLIHTVTVGGFLRIGALLGSYNRGLYLSVLFQSVVMALVMGYSVTRLYKRGVKRAYVLIVLALFCFTPLYSNFATMTIKDSLFNTWILLFFTYMTEFIFEDTNKLSVLRAIQLVGSGLLVMLFRNNGPIVFACMAAGFFLSLLLNRRINVKTKILQTLIICILPLVLYTVVNGLLIKGLNAKTINGKEVLSLPFQQTGRYIRDYETDVTVDEWQAIGKVLNLEINIGEEYDPNISDPLKTAFINEATASDIAGYLVVWFKMFFKHPGVYFEAFFNQIYGWFDLSVRNSVRYNGHMDIFYPPRWGDNTNLVNKWFEFLAANPVTGILESIALYVWWMALLIISLIKNRKRTGLVVFMFPLFTSLLVCVASPCCLLHPRYAFPIVFTIPYLTGYLMTCDNSDSTK